MLAKDMGVKVTFLDFDWDGLIPALLSKKADMLAADMTPTVKRAMRIGFTKPFMYTGSVVFVKADSPIKSVADAKKAGLKVAVLLGSTGESEAKKAFPQAEQKSYKGGGPLLIDAVLQGQADFGVNDASAVIGQQANYPPNALRIIPGSHLQGAAGLRGALRLDGPAGDRQPLLPQCRARRPAGAEPELLGQHPGLEKGSLNGRNETRAARAVRNGPPRAVLTRQSGANA